MSCLQPLFIYVKAVRQMGAMQVAKTQKSSLDTDADHYESSALRLNMVCNHTLQSCMLPHAFMKSQGFLSLHSHRVLCINIACTTCMHAWLHTAYLQTALSPHLPLPLILAIKMAQDVTADLHSTRFVTCIAFS